MDSFCPFQTLRQFQFWYCWNCLIVDDGRTCWHLDAERGATLRIWHSKSYWYLHFEDLCNRARNSIQSHVFFLTAFVHLDTSRITVRQSFVSRPPSQRVVGSLCTRKFELEARVISLGFVQWSRHFLFTQQGSHSPQ